MVVMNRESHNRQQQLYFSSADQPSILPKPSSYVKRHLETLIRVSGLKPGDHVLEIGAGMGRFTRELHERGIKVVASDVSDELIDKLKHHSPSISIVVGDVVNLPERINEHFDAIVGFFMLHHLPDLDAAFASMAQLLKPGGVAVFCEPNAYYFPFYLQILLNPRMRWRVDKGVVNMRPGVMFAAMRNAGLVPH